MADVVNSNSIILEALTEKLGGRILICPISGEAVTWNVDARTTALSVNDTPDKPLIVSKRVFPMAVLTCSDCGYTMLINLITLGVAEKLGMKVNSDEQ